MGMVYTIESARRGSTRLPREGVAARSVARHRDNRTAHPSGDNRRIVMSQRHPRQAADEAAAAAAAAAPLNPNAPVAEVAAASRASERPDAVAARARLDTADTLTNERNAIAEFVRRAKSAMAAVPVASHGAVASGYCGPRYNCFADAGQKQLMRDSLGAPFDNRRQLSRISEFPTSEADFNRLETAASGVTNANIVEAMRWGMRALAIERREVTANTPEKVPPESWNLRSYLQSLMGSAAANGRTR